jgi:tetratricopeptide (TPR) repeat protein
MKIEKRFRSRLAVRFGMPVLFALLSSFSLALLPRTAAAASACGGLANAFGPFDYRIALEAQRSTVERAHFTLGVETLVQAKSGPFGGDLDYTLRAFPNHPRALLTMSRLGLKMKVEKAVGANYPVDCYFDRAFRFAPDDPMPHLVFAIHLTSRNHKAEALEQLDIAAGLEKESTGFEFAYNMGLEYFQVGQYDKSLSYAQKAYERGAPFPGLRQKLQSVGKWTEAKAEVKTDATTDAKPD